eukprot:Mrub_04277.p1 GENE.Mrub_04277~~Mrub_04277.p1  ORF type:complete len:280 (-),score=36.71 Mrub_04277:57-896(-)
MGSCSTTRTLQVSCVPRGSRFSPHVYLNSYLLMANYLKLQKQANFFTNSKKETACQLYKDVSKFCIKKSKKPTGYNTREIDMSDQIFDQINDKKISDTKNKKTTTNTNLPLIHVLHSNGETSDYSYRKTDTNYDFKDNHDEDEDMSIHNYDMVDNISKNFRLVEISDDELNYINYLDSDFEKDTLTTKFLIYYNSGGNILTFYETSYDKEVMKTTKELLLDQTKLVVKGGIIKINKTDKIIYIGQDINLPKSMSDYNTIDVAKSLEEENYKGYQIVDWI